MFRFIYEIHLWLAVRIMPFYWLNSSREKMKSPNISHNIQNHKPCVLNACKHQPCGVIATLIKENRWNIEIIKSLDKTNKFASAEHETKIYIVESKILREKFDEFEDFYRSQEYVNPVQMNRINNSHHFHRFIAIKANKCVIIPKVYGIHHFDWVRCSLPDYYY